MDTINIREKITQLICETGFFVAPDAPNVHLFRDIAMDSLTFVTLLIQIESILGITFDITQMEDCAELDRLLELIEHKLGEGYCD